MKRLITTIATMMLLLGAASVHAGAFPMTGGPGFRSLVTPVDVVPIGPTATPSLGLRQWFNDQVAVDIGLGYSQFKIEPQPEKWTGFVVDVGLPLSVKRVNDKVNFILRPGFQWSSLEDKDETNANNNVKWTTIGVTGELEVEWMLAENLSVSAAHGVGYFRLEDDGNPKTTITSVGTSANNFTQLGFHVYLW